IPGPMSYGVLYRTVRKVLDESHMEGALKAEIERDPGKFVVADPELPLALLDLMHAGKKLLLITNSEWSYTRKMMSHAFDAWLPKGMTWRDLFDIVIVESRKPSFFLHENALFEVVNEEGLLRPTHTMGPKGTFHGGNAALIERSLGLTGEEILYVGDHIFADVHVSKNVLRWRTALVVRELEDELKAIEAFAPKQAELTRLMSDKAKLEAQFSDLRLGMQRLEKAYGPPPTLSPDAMRERMKVIRAELVTLDDRIAPLAREAGELMNKRWGLLMRAGSDKSNFARQLERYADVYLSRVSNLLFATPFSYARAPRLSMPHDPTPPDT
ncbi:MAG TPA: 5'-nucleotidase domain-containing protein, partial [bacterium]|nr:5'-nucleotidase domain-containing protein [bacterium]